VSVSGGIQYALSGKSEDGTGSALSGFYLNIAQRFTPKWHPVVMGRARFKQNIYKVFYANDLSSEKSANPSLNRDMRRKISVSVKLGNLELAKHEI
jgi:hypothetical protein